MCWGLAGVLLAAALVDALWLARETAAEPHGTWDAWAIWNVRARFFFRADHDWTNAFIASHGHPDYPLLLPLTVARFWSYVGSETTVVPRALSLAYLGGMLALTVTTLAALRGWIQGLVAGLVLLGTPQLIGHATAQDAEAPLAFWLLASCALLALRDFECASRSGLLVLAGAAAGMAAWTKNEGMLQLIALGGAVSLCAIRSTPREQGLREIRSFLLGALPATAIITAFKLGWAQPNAFVEGQGVAETSARLLDGRPLRHDRAEDAARVPAGRTVVRVAAARLGAGAGMAPTGPRYCCCPSRPRGRCCRVFFRLRGDAPRTDLAPRHFLPADPDDALAEPGVRVLCRVRERRGGTPPHGALQGGDATGEAAVGATEIAVRSALLTCKTLITENCGEGE